MDIQKINQNIKWQQLTAKEILRYKSEGKEVPNEFQKWAAAVSSVMNVQDDITYEMANGETDITALEEVVGKGIFKTDIQAPESTENNIGKENEQTKDEAEINLPQEATQEENLTQANMKITTDPNEIFKRKLQKGIEPLS